MDERSELTVVFDRPDKVYHPGEPITGYVEVQVDRECICRRLRLTVGWRTQGQGELKSGSQHTGVLFSGTWAAGETYRYPFSVTLPNGPYTYRGHLLNVIWSAEARAETSWLKNPQTTEDFTFTAGPPGPSSQALHQRHRRPRYPGVRQQPERYDRALLLPLHRLRRALRLQRARHR